MAWFSYLKKSIGDFSDDDCPTLAASLAFYALLSLPPLLLLIVEIAGAVYGQAAVQKAIQHQVASLMGGGAAGSVQGMVQQARANRSSWSGPLGVIVGIVVLGYGATGVLAQLQMALNRAWDIRRDPNAGIWGFVLKRIVSFGLILVLAAVLLASLVLAAVVSRVGGTVGLPGPLLQAFDFFATMAVIAVLVALLFKYFPDARIEWREAWRGAALTAVLFVIGKFLLGYYLAHSNPGSGYGAAGSLVLILLWVYYSAMIFLLGAEFTQVWARAHGKRIEPDKGAIRISGPEQRAA